MKKISLFFLLISLLVANHCLAQPSENAQRDMVNIVCNGTTQELKDALRVEKELWIIEDRLVEEKEYALYSAILLQKSDMAKVLLDKGVRPRSFSFMLSDLTDDIKNANAVRLFRKELETEKQNMEDGVEGDCDSGDPNAFFHYIHTPDMLEAILTANRDYCTLVNSCGVKITQILKQEFRKKEERQALIKTYRSVCR